MRLIEGRHNASLACALAMKWRNFAEQILTAEGYRLCMLTCCEQLKGESPGGTSTQLAHPLGAGLDEPEPGLGLGLLGLEPEPPGLDEDVEDDELDDAELLLLLLPLLEGLELLELELEPPLLMLEDTAEVVDPLATGGLFEVA